MKTLQYTLGAYLAIGFLWVPFCILTGIMKVRASDPLLGLVTLALSWPYVAVRMVANILAGTPNGSVW